MKSNIKRFLSLALVLVMVLSLVPATAFATGSSATAQNTTTGVQYADLSEAIAAAQAGQIVKALADAQDVVYNNEGVILDLNGYDLSNVTVSEGVTLSAIDSATDDYEGEYGSLTTEGTVAYTVKTTGDVKSYVTIAEDGVYSFHRYYASIAAINLKPADVALGYRAEFRGDEAVKNAVVDYGYEMWLNSGAHKTYSRADALEKSSLTLRVRNIMAEGNNALNALGATATIGGNAFITLNLGGEQVTLYGTEQKTTLRQVIEAINGSVSAYGEAQLEQVRALCTTYATWMEGWATENIFGMGNGGEVEGDLKVEIVVDVNAENGVLSQDATMTYGDITAIVPQGTVLENGATQLVLTITEKAKSDSGITAEEDETLIPLDVHIEGISADNTTPVLICLGEILPKGLNIGNYDLFHVENGNTVPMTRVYTLAELDTHNEFHYDPATGAVTVAMASFSEITLRNGAAKWTGEADHTWYDADATTLYIYNADQLWSLSQIVGGMTQDAEGNAIKDTEGNVIEDSFKGKTIVLYADIDLDDLDSEDGRVFYPIGYYSNDGKYEKTGEAISSWVKSFEGTFDGNGHTISNFYQNTWEMKGDHNWYDAALQYYRDGMGLFGRVYGGTVKNLTVKNFSSDGEICTTGTIAAYAECGATFENITIFNCNPRVYNIGNGGIVGCVGWYTVDVVDTPVTFKNITVDNTNKISALWGSYDVACGGLVGQYYPTSGQSSANYPANAGIHMENCHVAAQIDVYNDVCGNYMYYAYRYAGMLIGSVRENIQGDGSKLYPDTGRVYPNLDGITAENCTVHYGEWNHYYYCEFESNGHPSYAQADEYKFSRIPESELVRDSEGNVTGCTHDHTDVEDNRAVYLPFYDQLVTGYGWGVTSMGIADVPGVTVLDREIADSVEKFETVENVQTEYTSGAVISIGDLFQAAETDAEIDVDAVQVFVSPVDKENSTVSGTYAANTSDWTKGILVLTGAGEATISITDYNYCLETKLSVTVSAPAADNGTYEKVTTEPDDWTGNYLIVYDTYVFNGEDAANGYVTATVNGDKIEATDALKAVEVTIEAMDGGYAIKTTNGYIYGTSGSNKLNFNASEQLNTIEFESADSIIITSNTSVLRFNDASDQMRFRYYKSESYSGQKAISLYKYVAGESSVACDHADATVAITSATCTEFGEVVITCENCGTLQNALAKLGHDYSKEIETVEPTCTADGSTTYQCIRCTEKNIVTLDASGHNYVDGICGNCGEEEASFAGTYYIATKRSSGNYWYMTCNLGTASTKRYQAADSGLTTLPTEITAAESDKIFVIEKSGESSYIIYAQGVDGDNYLGWTSGNSGALVAKASAKAVTITPNAYGTCQISFDTRYLSLNNTAGNNYFAWYTGTQAQDLVLIPAKVCEHVNTTTSTTEATCTAPKTTVTTCTDCGAVVSTATEGEALGHSYSYTDNEDGTHTYDCGNCEDTGSAAHTFVEGTCSACGAEESTSTEPTVVLEITKDDFNTTSYAANNDTHTDGDYSFTSYQVMQQSGTMQWQKSKGYITIASNEFVKLELKVTAGTYTVTVGSTTVTGTTVDGVTTYDLTGLTGEIKISVGSVTGKTEYLKFYK